MKIERAYQKTLLSELMVAIKSSTIDIEEGMCAEKE
jgi:hypothetical protein